MTKTPKSLERGRKLLSEKKSPAAEKFELSLRKLRALFDRESTLRENEARSHDELVRSRAASDAEMIREGSKVIELEAKLEAQENLLKASHLNIDKEKKERAILEMRLAQIEQDKEQIKTEFEQKLIAEQKTIAALREKQISYPKENDASTEQLAKTIAENERLQTENNRLRKAARDFKNKYESLKKNEESQIAAHAASLAQQNEVLRKQFEEALNEEKNLRQIQSEKLSNAQNKITQLQAQIVKTKTSFEARLAAAEATKNELELSTAQAIAQTKKDATLHQELKASQDRCAAAEAVSTKLRTFLREQKQKHTTALNEQRAQEAALQSRLQTAQAMITALQSNHSDKQQVNKKRNLQEQVQEAEATSAALDKQLAQQIQQNKRAKTIPHSSKEHSDHVNQSPEEQKTVDPEPSNSVIIIDDDEPMPTADDETKALEEEAAVEEEVAPAHHPAEEEELAVEQEPVPAPATGMEEESAAYEEEEDEGDVVPVAAIEEEEVEVAEAQESEEAAAVPIVQEEAPLAEEEEVEEDVDAVEEPIAAEKDQEEEEGSVVASSPAPAVATTTEEEDIIVVEEPPAAAVAVEDVVEEEIAPSAEEEEEDIVGEEDADDAVAAAEEEEEEEEDEDEEEEEIPEEFSEHKFKSVEEQQAAIQNSALKQCLLGTIVVLIFSDPITDVLTEVGTRTGINAFYIGFVVAPLVTNGSELLASYTFALKKTSKSMIVAYEQLLGAAVMNNTYCLFIFIILIYAQALYWSYTAEVISILFAEIMIFCVVFFFKVHTMKTAFFVLSIYPIVIGMVYCLETFVGLS
mmetsp:Transcript_4012/g.6153  ORF Transcript_4012/g.6153 Transcript_4012/m.6153 type:complete len:808 (-) Transcript_4012:2194-4617(-)